MATLLTVVGATGTQGGSVVTAALGDGRYRVRGITRDPASAKADVLRQRGVEVVQADLNDAGSLRAAFAGSAAIFGTTDFFAPFAVFGLDQAMAIEAAQGLNIAQAAAQTPTLEHFVWSTLPNSQRISGGTRTVPHFQVKNRVDDYIAQDAALQAKTTRLWITYYGNNYRYPMFAPTLMPTSGLYFQLSPAAASTPVPTIGDPDKNIGLFAMAILHQPEKTLPGGLVKAHAEDTTLGQMLQDWSAVVGRPAVYVETSLADYSALWPGWAEEMGLMLRLWHDCKEESWLDGTTSVLDKADLGRSQEQLGGFKEALEAMEGPG